MSEFRLKLRDAKDRPATIAEHRALIEEIERLRSIAFGAEEDCLELKREIKQLKKERDRAYGMGHESAKTERSATIEECAQIAQSYLDDTDEFGCGVAIAAAIRALKDKP